MAFVFGRETDRPHGALSGPATKLAASSEPLLRAIGTNLLYDRRVSEDRADHFFAFTGKPSSAPALRDALDLYVKEWIAVEKPELTYLAPDNSENILTNNEKFDLAHVLNLSALCYRLSADPKVPAVDRSRLQNAYKEFLPFVADHTAKPDKLEELLNDVMGWAHRLNGNRPVWGARWTQLKGYLQREQADTWNSAVGVFRTRQTLQLVLRYSARGAQLARPTQIDIGQYAYHFPSPPGLDKKHGGFAMCLQDLGMSRRGIVSEYIHPPRQFCCAEWKRAGAWCGEHAGTLEDLADIGLFRTQHLERLGRNRLVKSNPEALEWVEKVQK